jgi:hypothetical protein
MINLKRDAKLAIVGNIIGGLCVAIFFVVLQFFAGPSVLLMLSTLSPAIISGLIGGFIGAVIAIRRRPDERAKLVLKDSARNAFWFVLLALPYLGIVFMFMPAWSALLCGMWLLAFWFLVFAIFYVSAVYYYWK